MGLGYIAARGAYRKVSRGIDNLAHQKRLSDMITLEQAEAAGAAVGTVTGKAAHGAAYNVGVLIGKAQNVQAAHAEAQAAKPAKPAKAPKVVKPGKAKWVGTYTEGPHAGLAMWRYKDGSTELRQVPNPELVPVRRAA